MAELFSFRQNEPIAGAYPCDTLFCMKKLFSLLVLVSMFAVPLEALAAPHVPATRWVAAGTVLQYSDDNGVTWQNATAPCNPIVVAHNATLWLGGGSGSCIISSADGITWTRTSFSDFTVINALAWNGSVWVAGGNGSKISYSTDGQNWTPALAVPLGQVLGIGSNGSRFVAVSEVGSGNSVAYSDDGSTWTGAGNPFSTYGRAVAYNGSRWVIGGGTNKATAIQYSDDNGVTWTSASLPSFLTSGFVFNIAWSGTRFVAVSNFDNGVNTVPVLYSTDGITWTGLLDTFGGIGVSEGLSVAWNGNIFLAGSRGGTNTLISSPDGVVWTGLGVPMSQIFSLSGTSGKVSPACTKAHRHHIRRHHHKKDVPVVARCKVKDGHHHHHR